MLNVAWSNLLVSLSVFVATTSLLLQYISHRSTALDSAYDREEQIDGKIKKLGNLYTNGFTADEHTIETKLIKPTVNEKDSLRYRIWKYINPFLHIQGTTEINFKLTQSPDLRSGDYEITGDFENTSIEEIELCIMPESADLLFVTADSVEISDIASSLSDIDSIDGLKIQKYNKE